MARQLQHSLLYLFLCYAIPIFFHLCTYTFVRIFYLSSRSHNTLLEGIKHIVKSFYLLDNLFVGYHLFKV